MQAQKAAQHNKVVLAATDVSMCWRPPTNGNAANLQQQRYADALRQRPELSQLERLVGLNLAGHPQANSAVSIIAPSGAARLAVPPLPHPPPPPFRYGPGPT